jgi:transposase
MYESLYPYMPIWGMLSDIELTRKQKEQRRFLAAKDLEKGMSQAEVARKYHVDDSTACRWDQARKEKGLDGLKATKAPGREPKLSVEQKDELVELLKDGAVKSGFQTDIWTGKRVCELIKDQFDVDYHFKHIPRLLRALGFRQVKPKRKAHEQNEEKRQEWIENTWEYAKKN